MKEILVGNPLITSANTGGPKLQRLQPLQFSKQIPADSRGNVNNNMQPNLLSCCNSIFHNQWEKCDLSPVRVVDEHYKKNEYQKKIVLTSFEHNFYYTTAKRQLLQINQNKTKAFAEKTRPAFYWSFIELFETLLFEVSCVYTK